MKDALARTSSALLALLLSGCIYVRASSDDLFDEFLDHGDLDTLTSELDAALVDPSYELSVRANPWHQEATWSVHFVAAGSDREAAMASARRAVLRRVQSERGRVVEEHDHGPRAWACVFVTDEDGDEPGRAEVRWRTGEARDGRDARLEITWEEAD